MGDELWCGQAQYGVNQVFDLKFDLEDQGRSLHKTIKTLTKLFCIFGPNFVILAWTSPELSRRQASDWQKDWHIHTERDAGNDNTLRSKLASYKKYSSDLICQLWNYIKWELMVCLIYQLWNYIYIYIIDLHTGLYID